MAETRTLWLTALQISAAMAAGAGADRLAVTTFETSATVREVRYLDDDGDGAYDKIGVGLTTKIGDCTGDREYIFDADGTNPRLNGHPTSDSDALAIGVAAATLYQQAAAIDRSIADRPVGARLLSDGKIEVALVARDGRKDVIFEPDGTAPKIHADLIDDQTVKDVGAVAAAFKVTASERAALLTAKLTEPLPVQRLPDILPHEVPDPVDPPGRSERVEAEPIR